MLKFTRYDKGGIPLADKIGPKLHMAGVDFSIQHMRKAGYIKMPRPHSHTSYELYYLLDGERVYFMNGSVYTAQKGDIVIVEPGDLHSTSSSELPEFERILINFTPNFLTEVAGWLDGIFPFGKSLLIRFPFKAQATIDRLLLQMVDECKEPISYNKTVVRALLIELLVHIRRTIDLEQNIVIEKHPMHQKISEIAGYIQQNHAEPILLEKVAKQFFISPSYLSRIFVKLTGFHFREYVQVVRIREAEKQLRNTKEKVQNIADHVGFERIEHFNRVFKKLNGLSPLQYRKLN